MMKQKKGFTLIELLAVIIIITIIMLIAVPQVLKVIDTAKLSSYSASIMAIIKQTEIDYLGQTDKAIDITEIKARKNSFSSGSVIIDSKGKISAFGMIDQVCVYKSPNTSEPKSSYIDLSKETCTIYGIKRNNITFDPTKTELMTLNYQDSKENISNPERGFYRMLTVSLKQNITDDDISSMVQITNYEIIEKLVPSGGSIFLIIVDLTEFKNRDINKIDLKILEKVLDVCRSLGVKTSIRFRYGKNEEPNTFNQMLNHITQVKDILFNYQDIIYLYQAGYIGAYGEWHSTKYSDISFKNQVISKMLDNSPSTTQIGLRRPNFYREYVNAVSPSEEVKMRIGIFNDAFLSTETDMGTYESGTREQELLWLNEKTQTTHFGGESICYDLEGATPCLNRSYNHIDNALREMKLTHSSYFNSLHDEDLLEKWKNEYVTNAMDPTYIGMSYFDYANRMLGYRFVITKSKIDPSVEQGGNINMSLDIKNVGFGNVINKKDIYVMIEQDGVYYMSQINQDIRNWKTGTTQTIDLVFSIPYSIKPGKWNVYLKLIDPLAVDENNDFYIKFANKDMYSQLYRANKVGQINIVKENYDYRKTIHFLQLNTDQSYPEITNNDKPIVRNYVMDGNNTEGIEWHSSKLINKNSSSYDTTKIYADIVKGNLYLYIEDNEMNPLADNGKNIDLFFGVKGQQKPLYSSNRYKYWIQNAIEVKFYNDQSSWEKTIYKPMVFRNRGYEYKIDIDSIHVKEIKDITNIRITISNPSWAENRKFDIVID